MVKDRKVVEEKMRERVATAGKYLKEGMEAAPDPLDILLKDPDGYAKKLLDALNEAIRKGEFKIGLEKAKKRNKWKEAIDIAARRFEEVADKMVARALEDYEARKKCIEEAKAKIANMPATTRDQRIARSAAYQKAVAECFDRLYGRK